jgi:regulator of replication initiation timing
MKDSTLLAQREKIFDQYRAASKKCEVISKDIQDMRVTVSRLQEEYNRRSKEKNYLDALIKIMIYHDCDPVEAKLKYDEEIVAKMEGNSEADAKSASPGMAIRSW